MKEKLLKLATLGLALFSCVLSAKSLKKAVALYKRTN